MWQLFGEKHTPPDCPEKCTDSQDLFNINSSNTLYFDPCYYVNHCLIYIYHRKIPNHPHVCFIKISNPWKSLVGYFFKDLILRLLMFVAPETQPARLDFGSSETSETSEVRLLVIFGWSGWIPMKSEARCLTKHFLARWMSRVGSLGSMVGCNPILINWVY